MKKNMGVYTMPVCLLFLLDGHACSFPFFPCLLTFFVSLFSLFSANNESISHYPPRFRPPFLSFDSRLSLCFCRIMPLSRYQAPLRGGGVEQGPL
ncbi:hypothetical protein M440DRAFT_286538 [Trichoderma longibrachiatum ATCC 18648]|uniref:Uncharacterized protein n=1 Tax=Trichoderma longibrachiatum ATCC 18648 TaxID=983965 RepID=A0A2T4C7Z3_TRILO|nr:hypothetical protein M440DRAFT_286538 [Trichoderma longibrachiatum ATCC 18648]